MEIYSEDVYRLLAAGPARLPLLQADLEHVASDLDIRSLDATRIFAGARRPQGALAGLLLRAGHWDASHSVAQDESSVEGSYWHGILHRVEPDAFNAGYWFRRVSKHPIFPDLSHRAAEILKIQGPNHWRLKAGWDPAQFVEWCDEARQKGGEAETAAIEIQMAEWQLLFDWCRAAG